MVWAGAGFRVHRGLDWVILRKGLGLGISQMGCPVLAQNRLFSTVFHILLGKNITLFSILGTVYGGIRGSKERYKLILVSQKSKYFMQPC